MIQAQNNGANFLLGLLARLMPVMLFLYWPLYGMNQDITPMLLRPTMMALAGLMGVFMLAQPMAAIERRLLRVFGFMWLALLFTSVVAEHPLTALAEWVKLILIQIFCLLMTRVLRNKPTARILGRWLLAASLGIGLFIIFVYVRQMGLTLPTYTALRNMKGALSKEHLPLNPIAATGILTWLCAICLVRVTKMIWAIGFVVVIIGAFLTGSRAALAITLASGLVVVLVDLTQSSSFVKRTVGWAAIGLGIAAVLYVVFFVDSRVLVAVSEGRWDLWRAAGSKFLERPIFGYGYASWKDDLVSRLPGEYTLTNELVAQIAGAYHNEYVTAFAEQGLVGAAAVLTMYFFVARCAFRLSYGNWRLWKNGKLPMLGIAFLMLRASVEIPGLFGYAQEPNDYLAYIFVGILVSNLALEEDYARAVYVYVQRQRAAAAQKARIFRPASVRVMSEPAPNES